MQTIQNQQFQAQQQQIEQNASAEQQRAYILNEKLKKYIGVINSGYGQQGLSASDGIYLGNQYQNNLGTINQNKQSQMMGLYQNQAAMNYQNLQTESQRAYEQSMNLDQRAYNEGLMQQDRDYQMQQGVVQNITTSLEGELGRILSEYPADKRVNPQTLKKQLLTSIAGKDVPESYQKYIETYIDALVSSATYGYKQTEEE